MHFDCRLNINGAPDTEILTERHAYRYMHTCTPVNQKAYTLPTAPVQVSVEPSLMLMHVRCNMVQANISIETHAPALPAHKNAYASTSRPRGVVVSYA